MVASATSAVMILYTSFTATTSFIVFGLLQASPLPPPLPISLSLSPPPPILITR